MTKHVKLVTFINDREGREYGEHQLTRLVNHGYTIITAGGGNAADLMWGFVVLQTEGDPLPDEIDALKEDVPSQQSDSAD